MTFLHAQAPVLFLSCQMQEAPSCRWSPGLPGGVCVPSHLPLFSLAHSDPSLSSQSWLSAFNMLSYIPLKWKILLHPTSTQSHASSSLSNFLDKFLSSFPPEERRLLSASPSSPCPPPTTVTRAWGSSALSFHGGCSSSNQGHSELWSWTTWCKLLYSRNVLADIRPVNLPEPRVP